MFTLFCGLELREMKRTHTMYLVQRAEDGVGGWEGLESWREGEAQ